MPPSLKTAARSVEFRAAPENRREVMPALLHPARRGGHRDAEQAVRLRVAVAIGEARARAEKLQLAGVVAVRGIDALLHLRRDALELGVGRRPVDLVEHHEDR